MQERGKADVRLGYLIIGQSDHIRTVSIHDIDIEVMYSTYEDAVQ